MSNSATEGLGLGAIGQIAVPVGDIERAIAFYRDVLGMRFLFKAPPGLGFFDCAGTLSSRGVRFEEGPHLIARMPDHELWMAFFRDPDENLLALMAEVRQE